MTAATRAPLGGYVPPEVVSSVFHSATVSDDVAILVAESHGGTTRLTWGDQGAVHLLGYGLEDLRGLGMQPATDGRPAPATVVIVLAATVALRTAAEGVGPGEQVQALSRSGATDRREASLARPVPTAVATRSFVAARQGELSA